MMVDYTSLVERGLSAEKQKWPKREYINLYWLNLTWEGLSTPKCFRVEILIDYHPIMFHIIDSYYERTSQNKYTSWDYLLHPFNTFDTLGLCHTKRFHRCVLLRHCCIQCRDWLSNGNKPIISILKKNCSGGNAWCDISLKVRIDCTLFSESCSQTAAFCCKQAVEYFTDCLRVKTLQSINTFRQGWLTGNLRSQVCSHSGAWMGAEYLRLALYLWQSWDIAYQQISEMESLASNKLRVWPL